MDKELVLRNLRRARQVIETASEEQFNMDYFRLERLHCKTLMCSLGWLASDPYFQEQGVWLETCGEPPQETFDRLNSLFGPHAYKRLFAIVNVGGWDEEILRRGGRRHGRQANCAGAYRPPVASSRSDGGA